MRHETPSRNEGRSATSTFTSGAPGRPAGVGGEPADRRFEASGADPTKASSVYADAYGGTFRVAPAADDFSFRYAYVGNDRLTLRTSDCAGALTGEVPHLKEYVVSWFRSGTGLLDLRRHVRAGTTSAPFLLPAERRFALDFTPHRQNLIHFGPEFFEDVATESHSGPRQPVSFDHEADADPSVLARWRAAVSEATASIVEAATAPLVRFTAELNLARALLALFPWRAWDVPAMLRRPSASRTRVALDYMHHHAHDPITPADAARAAGLHTRSLQQATQRHLGVSPSAYLRDIRLDRAHRDLTAGEPCSTTVAAVAREWGFGNLGRFASAYQGRFDERPSETLRR